MKKRKNFLLCCIIAAALCLSVIPAQSISAEEPGSAKKTAELIETDKEYERVTAANQTSWFQYKVKEAGYIKLNLIPTKPVDYSNYCSWDITVTVDNKKLIDGMTTSDEFSSAELGLKKGTVVYIKIVGNHGEEETSTPYLLSINNKKSSYWENEINDTKKQANTIKENKKYYGNSYYNGYPSASAEKDFFKFKAPKSGKLTVYFGGKELGNNYTCLYRLTVYVNSKEKANSLSSDYFKKIKTIDVKKGDTIYLVATTSESYNNYKLMVKYK